MQAAVHRLSAAGPSDMAELDDAIAQGLIRPDTMVAVLGKTEGNGCVNDFTRSFATTSFRACLARHLGVSAAEVEARVALVMSGGTEGGLSPHWLVFTVDRAAATTRTHHGKSLAIGVTFTRLFTPEEIGRRPQAVATAQAVKAAMADAAIDDPNDVHFVQVKCPLLTARRTAEAAARGARVVTLDTYESMGFSRGASALGVAMALGEVADEAVQDERICRDFELFSGHASTSAGIELMRNEVLVLGNSPAWNSHFAIGHAMMADALDVTAVDRACQMIDATLGYAAGTTQTDHIAALFCKAEASHTGTIRGHRHIMLDDSDINATRHARALVGGVLAGRIGDTRLFVSGGAEHQGPQGGGPLAVIVSLRP
jgi:cyanuric acid amidohydrolase